MSLLRAIALAVPLLGATVAAPAQTQAVSGSRPRAAALPAVEGFVAEKVPRLVTGVPLNFSVFGSERAAVCVYVEGVPALVDLHEVQPGVYEGTYVIAAGDAPRADSQVVATLQRGGHVARATLAEPLVLAAASLPWSQASGSGGSPFEPARPAARDSAPAAAEMAVAAYADVARRSQPVPAVEATIAAGRCENCAIVESIRSVETASPSSLSGKLARAMEDHRRRVLGVLGAIGVPSAGRESQRLADRATEFEVTLRLADGRAVIRRFGTRPTLRVGDPVTLPLAEGRVADGS